MREESDFREVPTDIDVVRDSGSWSERRRDNLSQLDSDPRQQMLTDLASRVRDAVIHEHVADALSERLAAVAREQVRNVIRTNTARDLRRALHDVAAGRKKPEDVRNVLDDRLSDEIEKRVVDALRARLGCELRGRAFETIRSAIAGTRFAQQFGDDSAEEIATWVHARIENAVRERISDALRGVARGRVRTIARERLQDGLRQAAEARQTEQDNGDRGLTAISDHIEKALNEQVADALQDRIRAILREVIYDATGVRLRDGLRQRLREPGAEARYDGGATNERPTALRRCAELEVQLQRFIGERIRDRLADALRDRIELTVREAIEESVRDRLSVAIRFALAEQRGLNGFNCNRLVDALRYQLGETLQSRVNEAVRARIAESLRTQLADAIESGVAQVESS